jgi:hypothetical protein
MQELILIISRCVSKRKSPRSEKSFYCFHFKGFYRGEKVKVIHLYSEGLEENLSKGDDYLLWVKRKNIKDEVLEVDLIKHKKII